MSRAWRLMAVLAHPDDESLGCGGTLAKYAAEGVETSLVTATRGERGRFHGHPNGSARHPGAEAMATVRERELQAAASTLGIRDVTLLDYRDQELDRADPGEAISQIAEHIRRVRPEVVLTFGPEGAYGHPDHIAISQLTTAAAVAAADAGCSHRTSGQHEPHAISKLYYIAWPASSWTAYQEAFPSSGSTVDGVLRKATPWPDWAITTTIDTRAWWTTVWQAVSCHASQVSAYERLRDLSPASHELLWGQQSFYRAFSRVNGGRTLERDLFDGLRGSR